MNRYFLELAYKGTKYSGFQIQENAITIQSEVEKAFSTFFRKEFSMTGSSRTDAGVHALQNFFHFDSEKIIEERNIYNINSILPDDIVVKSISLMNSLQDGRVPHARFDAVSRSYKYFIGRNKDPFNKETVLYYPYKLEIDRLQECALLLKEYTDFTSFSKKNTQVKTFNCSITESNWNIDGGMLIYYVKANRFLRGMVRALVGTMLQAGRNKISIEEFRSIIDARDCSRADFSAAAHGLFLVEVRYPENFFPLESSRDRYF